MALEADRLFAQVFGTFDDDRVGPSSDADFGPASPVSPAVVLASDRDGQPTSIGDLSAELDASATSPAVANVIENMSSSGPDDVLAFYVPFSRSPSRWGIYLREFPLSAVTIHVASRCLALDPSILLDDVRQAVYRFVLTHELVHFGIEYAAALAGAAQGGTDLYRSTVGRGARADEEEMLATAFEMHLSIHRAGPKFARSHRQIIAEQWQGLPLPQPYSSWGQRATLNDAAFAPISGHMAGNAGLSRALRDACRLAVTDQGRRAVPLFLLTRQPVGVGAPLASLLPRLVALEPKSLVAWLRRIAGRPPFLDVSVVSGKQHPVTVKRPGHRSVDLDPKKWDRTPHRVLRQLGDLLDLSPDAIVNSVRG